ncbi:HAD-IA family hydrolase [Aliikangiella sp. G2MR2-5]|uniref:HAD-IA family hydrolase n=1 Tax=Aliikangiella sp. G2MR2-5 TaxID=2788943 RepID=UPI0018A95FDC|nr:HAD-IA family hydrolase [Aliikangiella sp. G2MR2-5]
MASFEVISFDLDNALYDNQPVLNNAEAACNQVLDIEFAAQGQVFQVEAFQAIRRQLLTENNIQYENLSHFRKCALNQLCRGLKDSARIVEKAFTQFIRYRSQITVLPEIMSMMSALSQKYTLVAVSNGNCDLTRTALSPFFEKHYSPTFGFRAKPHPQMLQAVISDFYITADKLLHVGDSMDKDGQSASAAECEFYHFAPFQGELSVGQHCTRLINFVSNKK